MDTITVQNQPDITPQCICRAIYITRCGMWIKRSPLQTSKSRPSWILDHLLLTRGLQRGDGGGGGVAAAAAASAAAGSKTAQWAD